MAEEPEASALTARRAAQHFRLSSADDACEHLYILTARSRLGPSPPNAGRYTVASRFRCRSCERGYIFPRAPEQFVASPLCLVGYVRWDARSDRVPPLPSSQARLLAPSPLRTVRNTFALHGSSTPQRPLNERGRSLIQVQVRPTRYWLTADSHGDGKFTRRVGSRTNGLRRRHLLCFLHRFHRRSRVRAPAKSLLRFRRGDVVPRRRRNLYLPDYRAAFAFSRAPIPASPLSASRFPTPRLWRAIRAYPVPLR